MRFFKPIYYTFKPMSRQILVHYIVIGLLLTLSVGLVVKITKNKETLNNLYYSLIIISKYYKLILPHRYEEIKFALDLIN